MTAAVPPAILALSVVLALGLLLLPGESRRMRTVRGLVHVASLLGFGLAGWSLGRGSHGSLAIPVLLSGFVLTGILWIVSIRRRFAGGPAEGQGISDDPGAEERPGIDAAGDLGPQGRAILDRLVEMKRKPIASLGTPRERIVHAERDGGIEAALSLMRRRRFLRIPMVDGSLDRIVGVLHAKDVVPGWLDGTRDRPLKMILRRPLFVSSDRTIASLIELFRSQRGHLAIVVDEYNRTLALVSRDDVFRYLSGEER